MAGEIDFGSIGGIASQYASSFSTMFFVILAIAMFGGIVIGISMIIARVKKYDITTRIYSNRYGGCKTWDEPGAYTKHKDTGDITGFQIKGVKKIQNPPPLSCLYPNEKGKNTVHAIQLSFDEYVWVNPQIDNLYAMLKKAPIIPDTKPVPVELPKQEEVKNAPAI